MNRQHVATYRELPNGRYLIDCGACAFKEEGPMTRNEAHLIAFRHTANPPTEGI